MFRYRSRFFQRFPLLFPALLLIFFAASCSHERSIQEKQTVLTIAHEGELLGLDPQRYDDGIVWSVLGNVYEPLVSYDANMMLASKLAERWENPNDLTWRFYLRKNVRFHNGKPFQAEDVVYTIKRGLLTLNTGTKTYLINVAEARAIGTHTVDIITSRPHPVLLNMLTFVNILPANDGDLSKMIDKPVGTGPYMFEKMLPQNQVVLKANRDYWGGPPSIDRVQFTSFATDEEAVDALLAGKVHLIRDFSEMLIPKVKQSNTSEVLTHDGLGITLLGFNLADSDKDNPFNRREVRKAIYHALDMKRHVSESLGGHGNAAFQLVSPNIFGFDPGFAPVETDLELARDLLAKAGYPSGFSSEIYGSRSDLKEISQQLEQIGIRLKVQVTQWKELYEKTTKREIPVYTLTWSCSTGDASDFLNSLVHSPDPQRGYGNFNLALYNNQEVDQLIERIGATLKVNERKTMLQRALQKVMNDYPYIPLYSRYRHYGVSSDLEWHPRRDGRLYASEIRWKQPQ